MNPAACTICGKEASRSVHHPFGGDPHAHPFASPCVRVAPDRIHDSWCMTHNARMRSYSIICDSVTTDDDTCAAPNVNDCPDGAYCSTHGIYGRETLDVHGILQDLSVAEQFEKHAGRQISDQHPISIARKLLAALTERDHQIPDYREYLSRKLDGLDHQFDNPHGGDHCLRCALHRDAHK